MIRPRDIDLEAFEKKILAREPRVVAFNGKKPGVIWLGDHSLRWLDYGRVVSRPTEFPEVFILPSTSGANGHWDIEPWQELSAFSSRF